MDDGTIRFPWPAPCLWPNSRVDRRSASGTRRKYRQDCAWATRAAGFEKTSLESLHLVITFCPPDNRRRDLDNMLAAVKSGIDGLADVLEMDDVHFAYTIQRGDPVAGGEVRVQLGSMPGRDFIQFRGTVS